MLAWKTARFMVWLKSLITDRKNSTRGSRVSKTDFQVIVVLVYSAKKFRVQRSSHFSSGTLDQARLQGPYFMAYTDSTSPPFEINNNVSDMSIGGADFSPTWHFKRITCELQRVSPRDPLC